MAVLNFVVGATMSRFCKQSVAKSSGIPHSRCDAPCEGNVRTLVNFNLPFESARPNLKKKTAASATVLNFVVGAKGNQPFFLNPWFSCFFVFNPLKIPYKCITLCIPILKLSRFRPKVHVFIRHFQQIHRWIYQRTC